jgi:DNA-binding response OmpR family regulator
MVGKKTILIVEDEPVTRHLLEKTIGKKGYHTLSTDNGDQALTLIREHHPDLVMLDLMLPGAHGFSVCRQIKEDAQLKTIKVLILSAKAYPTDREIAFSVGADEYLVKSANVDQIVERVEALIGSSGSSDQGK